MSEPYSIPFITKLLRAMTPQQLASAQPHDFQMWPARLHRQLAQFMPDAVFARGAVTGALRRRGIIKGAMPHARLTELGEEVCRRIETQ